MRTGADGKQDATPTHFKAPLALRSRLRLTTLGLLAATALGGVLASVPLADPLAAPTATAAGQSVRTVTLRKGGTLESAIVEAGAARAEASEAARALAKQIDPRKLQPGQTLEVRFTDSGGKKKLWSVRVPLGSSNGLIAVASSSSFAVRTYDPSRDGDLLPAGTLPRMEGAVKARQATVKQGETLMDVAAALGAKRAEADRAIAVIGTLFDVRRLQIGQKVTATFGEAGLVGFAVALEGGIEIAAVLSEGGAFEPLRTSPEDRLQLAAEAEALRAQQQRAEVAAAVPAAPTAPDAAPVGVDIAVVTDTVQRGDTLLEIAMRLGADGGDALTASQALSSLFNLRMLRVGQVVTAVFGPGENGEPTRLLALSLTVDQEEEVIALLGDDGRFEPITTTPEGRDQLIAQTQALLNPPVQVAVAPAPPPLPVDAATLPLAADALALPMAALIGFDHQVKTLIVSRGDTLLDAAIGLGAKPSEALGATDALADVFDPRSLRIGQLVEATFGRLQPGSEHRLLALSVAVREDLEAIAFLSEAGDYASRRMSREQHEQMLAGRPPAEPAPVAAAAPQVAALTPPAPPAAPPAAPKVAPAAPRNAAPAFDWIATIDRTVTVRPGDTLMEAVLRSGATPAEAHEAIQALTKIFNPRQLQAGQALRLTFGNEAADRRLLAVNLKLSVEREVAALRARTGDFSPREIIKDLDVRGLKASGVIDESLYGSAEKAGVPINTLMEMIRIFSWDVDFQRDIRIGDRFEVFFEEYMDDAGRPVREGNVLYASLTLSGKELRLYRYEGADGIIDYYTDAGASVRKALLRTPMDGARLSSSFGMRRHPILGFSRMHQGIDFAAPAGTPIRAAGDGIIEIAGPNSGYGNYVLVRHAADYKTAYAHMSSFASGIRPGVRVRQGQTIGYVGATGLATGPHLHYEVLVRGHQVNPEGVKFPSGKKLEGRELAAFQNTKRTTDQARLKAEDLTKIAAR